MSLRLLLPVVFLLAAFAAPAWTQTGAEPSDRYVEVAGDHEFSGQLIVRPWQQEDWLQRGMTPAQAQVQRDRARDAVRAWAIQAYVWQTDEYLVRLAEPGRENQVSQQLLATGLFQYAEPDWILFPIASPNCPDDLQLGSQWHHDASIMDSCEGWDHETGDPSVVVGICDTGVRTTHEDLLRNRQEGYNAVDQLWESQGGDITPVAPHGTQTTGCAAANGNNLVGVAGVGWDLGHRMMRVSNTGGSANLSTLQLAARTSIEAGDRVASVSYTGVDNQSNLSLATYLKSIGGLLVWAAGNDGRFLNLNDRDADDIIVVGATDASDVLAGFSAMGQFMDLVAPGVSVFTTDSGSDSAYTAVSGTSFACPLAAGLCALIWASNPNLTPDDVERILKSGVQDLGTGGVDDTYGYGRIDTLGSMLAMRAIAFDLPGGVPPRVDPVGTTTVQVDVGSNTSAPVPGTGQLHWFDGTSWNQVAMDEPAPNQYVATIPSVPRSTCGSWIQYYFSADAADGFTYTEPLSAPLEVLSSQMVETATVLEDLDFESDNGWSVFDNQIRTGTWERGTPLGGGDREDPATDFDGSGQCWLTDNRDGDADVDGGPTSLWSPVYDLSGRRNVHLSYARWFGNDNQDIDRMDVYVSADAGNTWTLLESVADTPSWVVVDFDVTAYATSQFRVRYDVTDNPDDSVTEAGLDRFRIEELRCPMIFDVSPATVAPGGVLVFSTWKGQARTQAFLYVVQVSGVPFLYRVAIGSFNAQGDWALARGLPNDPSLSGLAIDLVSFGHDADGIPQATNVDGFLIQ